MSAQTGAPRGRAVPHRQGAGGEAAGLDGGGRGPRHAADPLRGGAAAAGGDAAAGRQEGPAGCGRTAPPGLVCVFSFGRGRRCTQNTAAVPMHTSKLLLTRGWKYQLKPTDWMENGKGEMIKLCAIKPPKNEV